MGQERSLNPLALAVLALLFERPMHPYEIAHTMRQRRLAESIKLNFGSLYHTVELLQRGGLVQPVATTRDGRRPERTTYELTEAGRAQLLDGLRDLIRFPVKEYPRFQAGLSFLSRLDRDEAAALLRARAGDLAQEHSTYAGVLEGLQARGLPRLVLIEVEYAQLLRAAEADWLHTVAAEIESGELRWPSLASDVPDDCPMPNSNQTPRPCHGADREGEK